ncbi:serine hydrolase [Blautia sp. MSJ-19]|uniref:serine hydrolase n=1 Tax=Blautia sp. MSJ-19 TaxID=2841517 RepID=UPI001C0ED2A1|nr:serine hydrolase [Blautia sp. MSJ-19]MBU5482543.1 class A beta-lactamase-related serine hydrolase [Blautia sp. MSJ-19]
MGHNKQKKPVFLYCIIVFLALVILGLGALTLYSLQDLTELRTKIADLQDTVQEITDSSAELINQAKELASLEDEQQSSATDSVDSQNDSSSTGVQEEGTLSPSHSSDSSTDESLENLLSQIKPLLPQNNGTWSVYVCNLMKKTEGSINVQPMQAASLIKLFIMGTVYENYDALCGAYDTDTINNYLNSMITVSDNDAANSLVNMLGGGDDAAGMNAVNSFCAAHGYTSTSMGRLLLQSNDNGDNYTSVEDCGHFLKEIYQSNAVTASSTLLHTDAMYALLKMQERRNKIPANLPDGVKVANKTGELEDVENDAGIIFNTAKNIDLVVCFMSQDLSDSSEAQAVIAQDSRLIYGYYNE